MNFNKCNFKKKWIKWLILGLLVLAIAIRGIVFLFERYHPKLVIVGAVVSNGRGCADIGRDILNRDGSAADSAIATLLCEGILLTHSMGIGGGFVATIYTKSQRKIETLIAREWAPLAAHQDMFVNVSQITGAKAVAVPGEVLGYWELHQRHGRLPWYELFEPTIRLCREGHWVSKYLAAALKINEKRIRMEPSMSDLFLKEDGSLYKEDDYIKRPVLADTLERIARNGVEEMYGNGMTAKLLVEDIQQMGGIITIEDLKNYRVEWKDKEHVQVSLRNGYTMYTTPLPSSGVILAFILRVMDGLYTDHLGVYWHRLIETFKHAYGQRSNLGDLRNETHLVNEIHATLYNLNSDQFINSIRNRIIDNSTRTDYQYYGGNFAIEEDHGTANMAVLAPNGDALTITSTINTYFGAKVRSIHTGIILNDEMDDFSTPGKLNTFGVPASAANFIQPGKRPLSSMCPVIVLDKKDNVKMLVGAAGGTKITTAVAQAMLKYLVLNETMDAAVNDGRIHHQLAPMVLSVEPTVPKNIIDYLEKVGHEIIITDKGTGFAALTAIGVRYGIPEPQYDYRRVGSYAVVQSKSKVV